MCTTCGCSGNGATLINPDNTIKALPATSTLHIHLEQSLLHNNDQIAKKNRDWFKRLNTQAINLLSSPGSGKTTLLEHTLKALSGTTPMAVIEGDQATSNDSERIRATGVKAVQVNTGTGCHLEAEMIHQAAHQLEPINDHLLFIENVGNLVCPALFDLGEQSRVVLLSVTEGDDKPLKYPHMFQSADLMLITKTDLLPYVDFNVDQCKSWARQINPSITIIPLSARSGDGMQDWLSWLTSAENRVKTQPSTILPKVGEL